MAKENIINPGPEHIQGWKEKYKTVHKLIIEDKIAYLRKPDRRTLSLAMTKISKGDIIGGSEAILENCWLGGDTEIKTDDDLFMAAVSKVGDLIQVKEAELEKL